VLSLFLAWLTASTLTPPSLNSNADSRRPSADSTTGREQPPHPPPSQKHQQHNMQAMTLPLISARLSAAQQNIHPLQLAPPNDFPRPSFNTCSSSSSESFLSSQVGAILDTFSTPQSESRSSSRRTSVQYQQPLTVAGFPQPVIRKKSSFASKIRSVFKPTVSKDSDETLHTEMLQHLQVLEQVMSMANQVDGTSSDCGSAYAYDDFLSNLVMKNGAQLSLMTPPLSLTSSIRPSMLEEQHRGSVSSTSSGDTALSADSPGGTNPAGGYQSSLSSLSSPDLSPTGSPKLKSVQPNAFSQQQQQQQTSPQTFIASDSFGPLEGPQQPLQQQHPLDRPLPLSPAARAQMALAQAQGQSVPGSGPFSPNTSKILPSIPSSEKRHSLEPTPTRTVKKRLSFASITSFFNPRGGESAAAAAAAAAEAIRKKQQRSSSVPNVEHPLVAVGRQIAGFQRRHSLNDLQESQDAAAAATAAAASAALAAAAATRRANGGGLIAPPWDKDLVSAQAARAASEVMASRRRSTMPTMSCVSVQSNATTGTSKGGKGSRKLGLFRRRTNKKKKADSTHGDHGTLSTVSAVAATKPLKSAMVHRPMHRSVSLKRSSSTGNRSSVYSVNGTKQHVLGGAMGPGGSMGHYPHPHYQHPHHQHQPLLSFANEANTCSRRTSEESLQSRGSSAGGPTRHRRQSSLAGRQASQQGHYPNVERKHRWSGLYSAADFHDFETLATPPTPRVTPVATRETFECQEDEYDFPQLNQLSSQSRRSSFCSSHGGDGGGAFSPASSGDHSYLPASPSRDMSNPSSPGPNPYANNQHPAAYHPQHHLSRRSSIHQCEVGNGGGNGIVVPVLPLSVAPRLSVDRTAMLESTPVAIVPAAVVGAVVGPPSSLPGMMVNPQQRFLLQQQQQQLQHQLQLQQQQMRIQQQLQMQQHHQQQFHQRQFQLSHHHSYAQQQQQQQQQHFMNSMVNQAASLQESTYGQQYSSYPAYTYQHVSPQAMPSHLYYPSSHPQQQQQQQQQQYTPPPSHQYTTQTTTPLSKSHPMPSTYSANMTSTSSSLHPTTSNTSTTSTSSGSNTTSAQSSSASASRPARQLHFSSAGPQIHWTWTPDQYDRSSDPHITAHRLTPAVAQKIKLELNHFKSQEMAVHENSRVHTHFFVN